MKFRRNSHYGNSPIAYPLQNSYHLGRKEKNDNVIKAPVVAFFVGVIMKKTVCLLLAIVVSCGVAFSFSCAKNKMVNARIERASQTEIVVLVESVSGNATAFDALEYLIQNEQITVEYSLGAYGVYITAINGQEEYSIESTITSSKGYSWALYTSDMDSAYEETTININGITCGKAGFGASSLMVKKGEIYAWVFEYYEFTW